MTKSSFKPTIKRQVNVPLLKMALDTPYYVRIMCPIYVGKDMPAAAGKKKMDPAHLVRVVNLETGELMEMIVNAVLESIITETYPGDEYIGLYYQITKHPKQNGKGYNPFSLFEIEAVDYEARPGVGEPQVRPPTSKSVSDDGPTTVNDTM